MAGTVYLIIGTDTGVGKTIATAALATYCIQQGKRVKAFKPVQSGVETGEQADMEVVAALAGLEPGDTVEGYRLEEPLAPDLAAERAGIHLPDLAIIADDIATATLDYDIILVEGAGGVSVNLDSDGHCIIDLAKRLLDRGVDTQAIVITRSGLGTLNHTQLTVWFLESHQVPIAGMVVGAAPTPDDLAGQLNMDVFGTGAYPPLFTVLPAGLGQLDTDSFQTVLTTHWDKHPMQWTLRP